MRQADPCDLVPSPRGGVIVSVDDVPDSGHSGSSAYVVQQPADKCLIAVHFIAAPGNQLCRMRHISGMFPPGTGIQFLGLCQFLECGFSVRKHIGSSFCTNAFTAPAEPWALLGVFQTSLFRALFVQQPGGYGDIPPGHLFPGKACGQRPERHRFRRGLLSGQKG